MRKSIRKLNQQNFETCVRQVTDSKQKSFKKYIGVFFYSLLVFPLVHAQQAQKADQQLCDITASISMAESELAFSPFNMNYSAISFIGDANFITLFELTAAGLVTPRLAKSWEIDEATSKMTIELDDRCRWSDGAAITAKDMVDGIRLMFTEPDIFVPGREYFGSGAEVLEGEADIADLGVKAVSGNRLEIEYVGSKELLMKALSQPFFTAVPNHLVEKGEVQWPSEDFLPVASGSYIGSVDKSKNNLITLTKNPYYCSHVPTSLETIKIRTDIPVRDTVREFLSNQIDVVSRATSRFMQTLERRSEMDKSFTLGSHKSVDNKAVYYLFVNQLKPELADPKVKAAVRLAIDHDLYRSSTMLGGVDRLHGYTPHYEGYNPPEYDYGSDNYEQRILQAQELMREAGYSESKPLVVDIPVRQKHYFKQMAEALAGMMRQIYIKPVLRDAGAGVTYYHNLDDGNFGLAFFVWAADFPDPGNFITGILDKRFIDEQIHKRLKKKLLDSGKLADQVERYKVLAEIEQELAELGHIIPLYILNRGWAIRKPLRFGDLSYLNLRNIHNDECLETSGTK